MLYIYLYRTIYYIKILAILYPYVCPFILTSFFILSLLSIPMRNCSRQLVLLTPMPNRAHNPDSDVMKLYTI